jgi:hypothetical protein
MSRKRREKQERRFSLSEPAKKYPPLDPELCKSFKGLAEIVLEGLRQDDPEIGYNEAGVAKLDEEIELLVKDGTNEGARFVAAGAFLGEAVIARTGGHWCWGPKLRDPIEFTHYGKPVDLARVAVAFDLQDEENEGCVLPFIRVGKRLDCSKEFSLTDFYALASPHFRPLPLGFNLEDLVPGLQEAIRLFGTEAILVSDLKDAQDQELLDRMTRDQKTTELILAGERLVGLPLPLEAIERPAMKQFVANTPAGHFAVVISRKDTFSYVHVPREGQLVEATPAAGPGGN